MKKLIAIGMASLMLAAAFCGCGENAVSTASQAASDAVSGAGRVADDVGNGVSQAVSEANSDMDKDKNNGKVDDGDGFIGESDTTSETETDAADTTAETTETE